MIFITILCMICGSSGAVSKGDEHVSYLFVCWHCLVFINKGTIIFSQVKSHSFSIDYVNNQFVKDGEPFRYVSGAMHYFRVPVQYWPDRMRKMRAAGLNALETYDINLTSQLYIKRYFTSCLLFRYVEWASHEPQPGVYTFEGNLDIESYFQWAQYFNLSVILRPGPFIDAERDMVM